MKIKINNQDYIDKRIDIVIPTIDNSFTRSKIQKLIKLNQLKVNDKYVKSSYLIKINDEIDIDYDTTPKLESEDIPLDIVYEDKYLMIVNKPRGLVVHPGNGNEKHTLVNALLHYTKSLSHIDESRPGIVHRIDKDTSGLLVVAKDDVTHLKLSEYLKIHEIKRSYLALVLGEIKEESGVIIAPIARSNNPLKMCVDIKRGKEAESSFKVIEKNSQSTLVKVDLKQGRTHQIRVHFEYIKHPVIGDLVYGRNNKNIIKDGQILHAYKLEFIHPITNKLIKVYAPIPNYFKNALKEYNLDYKLDVKRL